MQEVFLTDKYDDNIAVFDGKRAYSVKDLKKLIAAEMENIKTKKQNVVISGGDNFRFIIQFFASIYSNKTIYLSANNNHSLSIKDCDFLDKIELPGKEACTFSEIDFNKIMINFFTSGTTTEPKLIQKSLFNLINEAKDIIEEIPYPKGYSVCSTTTMCHLFGLTFHLLVPFLGKSIIATNPILYPEDIETKSVLISTPTFLNKLYKFNFENGNIPDYIFSAGSKLNNEVYKFLSQKSNVIEIYGSTETGVIGYKTEADKDFTKFKNVIVETNENSSKIFSEYIYGGVVDINDKLETIGNNIIFKSRTDRLFKVHDKRVSADELELELNKHDWVQKGYILKTGEKLGCLCALSPSGKTQIINKGIPDTTKALKKYLSNKFEIIPQRWKYTDSIPMTIEGKINKSIIERLFNIKLSIPVILDRIICKDKVEYKLFFHKNCNFFSGHFPQFPIVPGVVQLYLAKELANIHFGLNISSGTYKRIKFTNIIKSGSIVNLTLIKDEKSVSYEYSFDDTRYSSGMFLCKNIFKEYEHEFV